MFSGIAHKTAAVPIHISNQLLLLLLRHAWLLLLQGWGCRYVLWIPPTSKVHLCAAPTRGLD
jgi:hypothetical protein